MKKTKRARKRTLKRVSNWLLAGGAFVAWLVLQFVVFPRLGIPT